MTIKLLAIIPFLFTLSINNSVNAAPGTASGAISADTLKNIEQELKGQNQEKIINDTDKTQ